MKNFITKILVCLGIALLPCAASIEASDMTLTTYYPAMSGEYSQFRLVPRSVDLTGACTVGSFYVNSSYIPQYCSDISGAAAWSSIPGIWAQSGDNIFNTAIVVLGDGTEINPLNACDPLPPPFGNGGIDCNPASLQPTANIGIGTTTPNYKLTILNDSGIIAKGTFGSGVTLPDSLSTSGNSRLIWYPRKAAFRAGYSSDNSWDDAKIGNYSTAMGANTVASGAYSVVGGGGSNTASGQYSTVIGGQTNIASGNYSAVTGGRSNTAADVYTTISGGQGNVAATDYSSIIGGQNNSVTGHWNVGAGSHTVIGGGIHNRTFNAAYSNINGGKDNNITANISELLNTADYSVIGGGFSNTASNNHSVVSGGSNNIAARQYSSVGGGLNNVAGIMDGMVDINLDPIPTSGDYSRISGGSNNIANGDYSTISGGNNNIAPGSYSTVGGGASNAASGAYSVVSGGNQNTASGLYSMIVGGLNNVADGTYSWAGGRGMHLASPAARTFAWGYAETPVDVFTNDAFIIAPGNIGGAPWNPKVGIRDLNPSGVMEINANSTTDPFVYIKEIVGSKDIFVIKDTGYIGVQKTTPTVSSHAMQFGNANDAYLSTGGVWTNGSSRAAKENIKSLNEENARSVLEQLSPVTFNYTATPQQTNVGFIAEDVPALVAMDDRKSLSSMDIIAVLTKAAQDQQTKIVEQSEKIEKLKKEIHDLQQIMGE